MWSDPRGAQNWQVGLKSICGLLMSMSGFRWTVAYPPHAKRESVYGCEALRFAIFFKRRSIRSVGLMDKASASGAGDSRFESWADQIVWKGGSVLVGYSDCAYAPSRFHVFIVEIKGKVRTRTHTSLLAYICAQVLPTSASSSRNHAISDLKKINMLS